MSDNCSSLVERNLIGIWNLRDEDAALSETGEDSAASSHSQLPPQVLNKGNIEIPGCDFTLILAIALTHIVAVA